MKLDSQNLHDLASGAAFLGTGGGGDPYAGLVMAERALRDGQTIEVIDIAAVPGDAMVVPCSMVGAPTVSVEKLPGTAEAALALHKIEEIKGRSAYAVVASEIGGINGMLPLVIGAQTGLPVVDCDGMGRAFPEMQMVTFNVAGIHATPMVAADEYGNTVVIESRDAFDAERLIRTVVTAMGGAGFVVNYTMSGDELRRSAIVGSYSLALGIGEAIRSAQQLGNEPFASLRTYLCDNRGFQFADVLFDGKVADVARETRGGFVLGKAKIESLGASDGVLEISFKNENLVANLNGELRAIVPDLICILDRETADPIVTEQLRYGQRVKVFGVSAPAALRGKAGLPIFGPAAFGLEQAFTPVEKIND